MAAAKFLDTIGRLPGMTGEASDAVSACIQVKMTEAPESTRVPKKKCPETWIWIHPRQRPKSWDKIPDPVFPLERIFLVTHWQDVFGEGRVTGSADQKLDGAIYTHWECVYVHKKARLVLVCLRGRFVHGRNWKTRAVMVGDYSCKVSNK